MGDYPGLDFRGWKPLRWLRQGSAVLVLVFVFAVAFSMEVINWNEAIASGAELPSEGSGSNGPLVIPIIYDSDDEYPTLSRIGSLFAGEWIWRDDVDAGLFPWRNLPRGRIWRWSSFRNGIHISVNIPTDFKNGCVSCSNISGQNPYLWRGISSERSNREYSSDANLWSVGGNKFFSSQL